MDYTRPVRSRYSLWALVALLAAVAGLAAACGGGSAKTASASTSTTKPSSANGASFAASRAKFTSCLEAHGVPASEATQGFGRRGGFGQGGASGTSSSTATPPSTTAAYAAAFAACRSDLPTRGAGGFGNLQNSAAGRAYLQCLQLHGVTVPSTPPSTAAGSGSTPSGTGRSFANNPNFAAARQACAALAPARSGSSTTVAPAAS